MTAANLGAHLRRLRNAAGLSLEQVEEASGGKWKAGVVGSWEREGRRAPMAKADEYARQMYGHRLAFLPACVSDDEFAAALRIATSGVTALELDAALAIAQLLAAQGPTVLRQVA